MAHRGAYCKPQIINMKNSLLIYSGGLDSTVLLYKLAKEGLIAEALSVNYGQKHSKEISFARQNCAKLGVNFIEADISSLAPIFGQSSLVNASVEVPAGNYDSENMKSTVVPNRNMILLALATARAISLGCANVAYAAHLGDHAIYPDCRTVFADAMDAAMGLCDYKPIKLLRPFINMDKGAIVSLGAELGVDFNSTWSCYRGGKIHCGVCGTCSERKLAFKWAGIKDPTIYEA